MLLVQRKISQPRRFILDTTTKDTKAVIQGGKYKVDINTLTKLGVRPPITPKRYQAHLSETDVPALLDLTK